MNRWLGIVNSETVSSDDLLLTSRPSTHPLNQEGEPQNKDSLNKRVVTVKQSIVLNLCQTSKRLCLRCAWETRRSLGSQHLKESSKLRVEIPRGRRSSLCNRGLFVKGEESPNWESRHTGGQDPYHRRRTSTIQGLWEHKRKRKSQSFVNKNR